MFYDSEENSEESFLLRTIKFPKNLMYLSDRLPKQNYIKESENVKTPLKKKSLKLSQGDIKLPSI